MISNRMLTNNIEFHLSVELGGATVAWVNAEFVTF